MSTAVEAETQTTSDSGQKLVPLSEKATSWCRRIAGIAAKRAFRVRAHKDVQFDADKVKFYLLPKIFHRKRVSHTDGEKRILLHPDFFDEKGNIRKKLPKDEREELKAAIFKEVAHFAVRRPNSDFYKIMVRCPWKGPRVDGALGSATEARKVLDEKKMARAASRRKVVELPTGKTEDVHLYDLKAGKKVLVKGADIFLTEGSHIKIARGEYEGRKLRGMLSGGKELAKEMGLS